ncbi:hypothetical protein [Alteriqipengyuania sp. 357]
MKPQSIKLFDYFYLGAMFLGLLGFVSGYPIAKAQLAAQSAQSGFAVPPSVLVAFYVLGLLIGLVLWFLVSKRRWVIAKWAIVLFFLIALIDVGNYLAGPMRLHEIYGLLALIGRAVAVGMLFRGDAIRWLNQKPDDTTEG